MKALQRLRKFILAKSNTEEQHEIRLYVRENIHDLADAFEIPAETLAASLDNVTDDSALACRLLEVIRRAEALQRDQRKEKRAIAAQASAEVLASMVRWEGERAHLDLACLLASALTRRHDLLVFTCDEFTTAVYQAPLFDVARLKRQDLSAYVDASGLHVVWRTGRINLRPQEDANAERIVMSLPPRVAAAA